LRPRRPIYSLLLLALCLGTAVATAAPRQQGEGDSSRIFMPLGLKGVRMDELPVAPTLRPATATRTLTATPEDTATPTVTPTDLPTRTDVPSRTPTLQARSATIKGVLKVGTVPADLGLGDGFGPGLLIQRCVDEETCEDIARTGVEDEQGRFSFQVPVPIPAGRSYRFLWRNENAASGSPFTGADLWLGAYYGAPIRDLAADQVLDLGTIDIAPITLTGPSNGTGYSGLPWRFTWTPRANETGTYRWFFSDTQCKILEDRDPFFRSEPLGSKADGYLMSSYPPGTEIGIEHKYRWYVAADFPDGSRAESYYVWMLWFFFHHAFGPLGQDGPGMLLGR
jgi:hypothetical protein